MNPGCRVQDQLDTSEPTTPYIIGQELNLRKLPGRQLESNPQPSVQLQTMTIKTSASIETATTAYIPPPLYLLHIRTDKARQIEKPTVVKGRYIMLYLHHIRADKARQIEQPTVVKGRYIMLSKTL